MPAPFEPKAIVSWLFLLSHLPHSSLAIVFYHIWTDYYFKILENELKKDIFNLKTPKQSLKDTWNTWELNNKHSVKPWCSPQKNDDGYGVRPHIWSFGNNMEHSNGLQWYVNVILKFSLAVECLIIKRNCKSHRMKIEKILLYQNYAIFLQVAKKLW